MWLCLSPIQIRLHFKTMRLWKKYIFLMSSDWRAIIHEVEEDGVRAHMELNTKMGSKETLRGYLRRGAFSRVWGGHSAAGTVSSTD